MAKRLRNHSNFTESGEFHNPIYEDVLIRCTEGGEVARINRLVLAAFSPWILSKDDGDSFEDERVVFIDGCYDKGSLLILKNFCLSGILPFSNVDEINPNILDLFELFGIKLNRLDFSSVGKSDFSAFHEEVFGDNDEEYDDQVGDELLELEFEEIDDDEDEFGLNEAFEEDEVKPKIRGRKKKAKSQAAKVKSEPGDNDNDDDEDNGNDWGEEKPKLKRKTGKIYIKGPYKPRKPRNDGPFPCTECNFVAKRIDRLRIHKKEHQDGRAKSIKCKVCAHIYTSQNAYKEHFKLEHTKKTIQCEFCPQSVPIRYFERHREKHLSNFENCVQCGLKFASGSSSQKSHQESMGPYHDNKCAQCDEEFLTWEEHCGHVQTAHLNIWKYRCGLCPEVLDTITLKNKHRIDAHSKKSICEECGKSILEWDMKSHMARFHSPVNPEFTCPHCRKMFSKQTFLLTHVSQEHEPATCTTCGKEFEGRRRMTRHSKSVHDEKRFKCQYCDREYHNRIPFEDHLNTHTGYAPHSCDICNAKFKSASNRNAHVKQVHQGIKRVVKRA